MSLLFPEQQPGDQESAEYEKEFDTGEKIGRPIQGKDHAAWHG